MKGRRKAVLTVGFCFALLFPVKGSAKEMTEAIPQEFLEEYHIEFANNCRQEFQTIHTFEKEITWTGEEVARAKLLCWVYTRSSEGQPDIWYFEEKTAGGSGLLKITIPLQYIGEQQVLLMVMQRGGGENICLKTVQWTCYRRGEKTLKKLQQRYFNLYEMLEDLS